MAFDFDFQVILDKAFEIGYIILKLPFKYWNMLPQYVRNIIYGIILLLAIFVAWMTWKLRNEWRNRY